MPVPPAQRQSRRHGDGDTAFRNKEEVSATRWCQKLSYDALSKLATPFFVFSTLFLIVSIFLEQTLPPPLDGREIFPDTKVKKFYSSNRENELKLTKLV